LNINNKNIESMLHGQVSAYCEQVSAGAKLCAQLIIQNEYGEMIKTFIKKEKCKSIYFNEGKHFKVIFIYKYDFAKFIIYELVRRSKNKTPKAFEIWMSGKMFGYSDYEISKYLKKHGYLQKT
jgi:hypothetical protein